MNVVALATALAVMLPVALSTAPRSLGATPIDADSLCRRARVALALRSPDAHRRALDDYERAVRLAPDRFELWLELGRASASLGQLQRARVCLERAARLAPEDGPTQSALGEAWKQDWLASLEPASFRRAVDALAAGAERSPHDASPRVQLAALALLTDDVALARRAAASARLCDADGAEPLLAAGCAAYRAGDLATAATSFRRALPLLPEPIRRRFVDVSAIADNESEPPRRRPDEMHARAVAFWSPLDPDLTTPENEAELHYLSRVAHAVLLFRGPQGFTWDMRTELMARYGFPSRVQLHEPDDPLGHLYNTWKRAPYTPDPMAYPYNVQIWSYPELGMRITLWDRSLGQAYELPVSLTHDVAPQPDPARLAERADLMVLGNGAAVFRKLPPGTHPLPVRGATARLAGDVTTTLVGFVETPGPPSDSLWASWAVASGDQVRVVEDGDPMRPSACRPADVRTATFAADVSPGDYQIDLAVTNRRGGKGVVRLASRVADPTEGLRISDLVLVCDAPVSPGPPVRLEPNLDAAFGGPDLRVYFEIAGLRADPSGRSRFAYTYSIRATGRNRRSRTAFEATRHEEHAGSLRRQFVSAPIAALEPGHYELVIEVKDVITGRVARRVVEFAKV